MSTNTRELSGDQSREFVSENNYNDIIGLARPASKRPKMSREIRAAQFAPFAALEGHQTDINDAEAGSRYE